MIKKLVVICFITLFISIGCTSDPIGKSPDRDPDMIGLIYDINTDSQSILVVSDIESVEVPYAEWFEAGNYAVVFSIGKDTAINLNNTKVDFSALKKGQKVGVWHTGILAESYPMQGEAIHIEIND